MTVQGTLIAEAYNCSSLCKHDHAAADGQEEVASQHNKKKKSGGSRARAQLKVDKERLMTSTEAAETNEKLPKGFMYVPAHRLNSGAISGTD